MNCYDTSQPVDEELMTSGVILARDVAVQKVIVIIAHNSLTHCHTYNPHDCILIILISNYQA